MLKDVLRITTAGSVDDGKSTLIARLLLDTHSIPEDQLPKDQGKRLDPTRIADLLDGLESEREQGITIDVAHRFFSSSVRRYHLSDSPGHEQYTRNMATAAAGADALVLVIDSSAGIKPQTRKHLDIAYLLGLRNYIVVANKIDLINYSQRKFEKLKESVSDLFEPYEASAHQVIPASGTAGHGVVKRGSRLAWHEGPTLLEALDRLAPSSALRDSPVISVEMVQRLGSRERRYLGSVLAGSIHEGASVTAFPGKVNATINTLWRNGEPAREATYGSEISFTVREDRDIERGHVLAHDAEVSLSHSWDSTIAWLSDDPGVKGRPYIARVGHQSHRVSLSQVQHHGPEGPSEGRISTLETNGIYRVTVSAQQDFVISRFMDLPELGRLILIDPETGDTAAAGIINFSLRRSENVHLHEFSLDTGIRENLTGGAGSVLWFTGLSGSGKSTIADHVSQELTVQNRVVVVLDGDNLRHGLNSDLGFTETDRVENIRRTAEVAKLLADAGIVVLVSLISPYRKDRENAREIVGRDKFMEIYVATPIEVCEARDPKGLYKKARAGEIPNFTGIGAPYEAPSRADLVLDGSEPLKSLSTRVLALVKTV